VRIQESLFIFLRDLDLRFEFWNHLEYRDPPLSRVFMAYFNRCSGSSGLSTYLCIVRCCIAAKDNQPRPNHVYHLNSSESSPIANIATTTMTIPFPLQEALRDSITSGTFVDTKFWLFSKRASKPGRVGDPKPLFVNGHVARRVPRLASRALTSVV